MHVKHETSQTYKDWCPRNHALSQQMNEYCLECVELVIALKTKSLLNVLMHYFEVQGVINVTNGLATTH